MKSLQSKRVVSFCLIALMVVGSKAVVLQVQQDPKQQQPTEKQDRGLGVRPTSAETKAEQTGSGGSKPEIVLQAGIAVPQTMIGFSPDGRLLASMGMTGNSIKLWEVATGRLLRQLESSIPTMGSSTLSRPFRFSQDGQTIIAMADGRIRRWEVDSGRELQSTILTARGDLFSAQLSSDGKVLAGASLDNSKVRLWETASGRELTAITFKQDENMTGQDTLALSPDGKFVAVLTQSMKASMKSIELKFEAVVWDVSAGRRAQTIKVGSKSSRPGSVEPEGSVSFTPDGSALAVRNENSIKIFDLASGREIQSINSPRLFSLRSDGLGTFANKFLFSRDARVLSILGDGNGIKLVNGAGAELYSLPGHDGGVVGLSFSSDGKLFASSGLDNQIKLWDVASGKELRILSGSAEPTTDLAFSPDGRALTLAGPQGVSAWELSTGGVKRTLNLATVYGQAGPNVLMQRNSLLSDDGRLLIAGSSAEPLAKVWETATGREAQSIQLGQGKELASAAFSQDAKLVVLSERDKKQTNSSAAVGAQQSVIPDADVPMEMPDMTKMMEQMRKDPKKVQEQMKKVQEAMSKGDLTAGMSMMEALGMTSRKVNKPTNNLRLFEVASGRQTQTIPLPSGFLQDLSGSAFTSSSALAFSPDGRTLASATGFYGPLILRDAASGQELRTLKSPLTLTVNSLAWSRDGRQLAAAQWGLARNPMDPNANTTPDFSFEDVRFAIKIWDPQTGNEIHSLPGHGNFVGSLSFSPDAKLLASGSFDSTIKLWDLAAGREITTLRGHSGSITAVEFTPDGQFLVSASEDGSARLWQTQTGKLLATMVSLNKGVDWLVVTPDGLFDGSPGGWKQILWRFSPGLYDVEPVEIFFNEYFRPGLLPDLLAGNKLAAVVDIARKDRRQPKVALSSVDAQSSATEISERQLKVRISVSEAPAGAQDLRFFRNGSLVKAWRGDVLGGQASVSVEATVSIVAGENKLTAYAFNRDNVKSSDATMVLKGAGSLQRPATLHVLAVGVNQYANSAYNLKYAVADANAFAEEVKRQQEKLGRFQQIEVIPLLDRDATKANLLTALQRLTGFSSSPPAGVPLSITKIKPAQPEDVVIVYYAGHGTAQDQRFYLIPHDLGYEGTRTEIDQAGLQNILTHSISDLELEQAFAEMDAGLILMVIDACNSGQALEAEEKRRGPMNSKGLAQLAYEKGMYILTAAQSYQAALEAEQLGHGYLTFALVEEGLKSAAADNQPRDSQVVLREWLDYATERVPRMQEAKMRESRGVGLSVAFVEGEQKVVDVDKRSVQRPRVFYRREQETEPFVVVRP
jgi:WD40 repeat protein/uncharacterized caspase-like protein